MLPACFLKLAPLCCRAAAIDLDGWQVSAARAAASPPLSADRAAAAPAPAPLRRAPQQRGRRGQRVGGGGDPVHHQCEQQDSQNKPTRPRRCGVGGQACSVNLLVRIGGRKRRIKNMPKEYSQNILAMFFILFFAEYSPTSAWA